MLLSTARLGRTVLAGRPHRGIYLATVMYSRELDAGTRQRNISALIWDRLASAIPLLLVEIRPN